MRLSTPRRLRRLAVPLVAACSFTGAAATPASAASPCSAASTARTSTLCLINAERSAHGLRPAEARCAARPRVAPPLARHGRQAATSPMTPRSGTRFSARIARTGWMSGRATGASARTSPGAAARRPRPRSIVAAWMNSAGHRENILSAKFRVIGVGIALGNPRPAQPRAPPTRPTSAADSLGAGS